MTREEGKQKERQQKKQKNKCAVNNSNNNNDDENENKKEVNPLIPSYRAVFGPQINYFTKCLTHIILQILVLMFFFM